MNQKTTKPQICNHFKGSIFILLTSLLIMIATTSPLFAQGIAPLTDLNVRPVSEPLYPQTQESLQLPSTPLTPPGNMELVDDLPDQGPQDKAFITVKTKNDHIFYIIIDRQRETDQVYFLSLVDERTLLELVPGVTPALTPGTSSEPLTNTTLVPETTTSITQPPTPDLHSPKSATTLPLLIAVSLIILLTTTAALLLLRKKRRPKTPDYAQFFDREEETYINEDPLDPLTKKDESETSHDLFHG